MFNYATATKEEMLNQVLTVSPQIVSMARKYHLSKGHEDIVEKIDSARFRAKVKRLETKLSRIQGELDGHSSE